MNLSEECRENILETNVTAYDIFDEAREEVLALMEVRMDFTTLKNNMCSRLQALRIYRNSTLYRLCNGGAIDQYERKSACSPYASTATCAHDEACATDKDNDL